MLFNSIEFVVFLPLVFCIYWLLLGKSYKFQNLFLLLASYIFYGWWDPRFLILILLSTIVDFYIGIGLKVHLNSRIRKTLLITSIVVNIGVLFVFKYYDFFAQNFVDAFTFLGGRLKLNSLSIILPVGISFYTFQTLSYSIDIYKGKLEPTKNFISFAAFVSFFPQLVAGPIERATNLLPQFYKRRVFNYAQSVDGLRQILWGLFKKMVIADNCANIVDFIYASPSEHTGSTLFLGTIFFAIQIYCDFSGYSDIAIGTAKLFGFNLMRNFAYPYFSRDIAEFWRRWHISLSTWFRDYIYIPLGGSRGSRILKIRNVLIIFLISGFWHGANWTFIIWGAFHALFFLPVLLLNQNRDNLGTIAPSGLFPSFKTLIQMIFTFALVCLAWVFFRASNVHDAFVILKSVFSDSFISIPVFPKGAKKLFIIFIPLLFVMEWFFRDRQHGLDFRPKSSHRVVRYTIYQFLVLAIVMFRGDSNDFIYFQF